MDVYTEEYRSKNISEFVGNTNAVKQTKQFMIDCVNNKNPKPLLYIGNPGTGKTTLALLLAKTTDLSYEHHNMSGKLKADILKLSRKLRMRSLRSKKCLFILDEMDKMDKRTQGTLAKELRLSRQPVIIIGNFKDKISKEITKMTNVVPFYNPSDDEILERLEQLEMDNIPVNVRYEIAKKSNTIRSALNMLQSYVYSGHVGEEQGIMNLDKVGMLEELIVNGNTGIRQKLTPDEITTYLHDSYCKPRKVSDLDVINGRSRKVGYSQWGYYFRYLDHVRVKKICNFPYSWVLISRMKARRNKENEKTDDVKKRKLTKKELEKQKKKKNSLKRFF